LLQPLLSVFQIQAAAALNGCGPGFCCNKTNYALVKKVTFHFPTYESMWQFKSNTKAINLKMAPRQQLLTGLFSQEDIAMAESQYRADNRSSGRDMRP